jgi:hypothetical protein
MLKKLVAAIFQCIDPSLELFNRSKFLERERRGETFSRTLGL